MNQYQPVLQDAMVSRDYEAGLGGLRKIVAARKQVCDTHLFVIDELYRTLPPELGDNFRNTILSRGYADIYKRNSVDRLLESVRLLPDLTAEQSAAIDVIEAEYLAAIAQSNEQLLQAYRAFGGEIPILEAKRAIARRNKETLERGAGVPTQITDLKATRQKMLDDFRSRILELLTPEQSSKIPAAAKFDRRGDKLRERLGGALSPNGTQRGANGNTIRNLDKEPRKKGKSGGVLTPIKPQGKDDGKPKAISD
jgi:hypothetical protein